LKVATCAGFYYERRFRPGNTIFMVVMGIVETKHLAQYVDFLHKFCE